MIVRSTFAALLFTLSLPAIAQVEGPRQTQTLVTIESKNPPALIPTSLTAELNGKATPLTALTPLVPAQTQVAILIDDGLRSSVARQISDIQAFIQHLPAGTEVLVGYMQNGRVVSDAGFTSNLAAAASTLRIPIGMAGVASSPYFCLSDFVKNWPTREAAYGAPSSPGHKARFVLMITNGVDPYNGSVSPLNQNSPYVQTAITDAQRFGVVVSSIYYGGTNIRGGAANFSGQSYLSQTAEATGGESYYQGQFNPVTLAPYFARFATDIAQTEVATFLAPTKREDVTLRMKSNVKGVKVRVANSIRPGTVVVSGGL